MDNNKLSTERIVMDYHRGNFDFEKKRQKLLDTKISGIISTSSIIIAIMTFVSTELSKSFFNMNLPIGLYVILMLAIICPAIIITIALIIAIRHTKTAGYRYPMLNLEKIYKDLDSKQDENDKECNKEKKLIEHLANEYSDSYADNVDVDNKKADAVDKCYTLFGVGISLFVIIAFCLSLNGWNNHGQTENAKPSVENQVILSDCHCNNDNAVFSINDSLLENNDSISNTNN